MPIPSGGRAPATLAPSADRTPCDLRWDTIVDQIDAISATAKSPINSFRGCIHPECLL
jgi:hypothetical protein